MVFFKRTKASASTREKKTIPPAQERVLTAEGWRRKLSKQAKPAK